MESVRCRRNSIVDAGVLIIFFLLSEISIAGAQPDSSPDNNIIGRPILTPTVGFILCVLVSGLFFMTIATICFRISPAVTGPRSGGFSGPSASCKARGGLDPSVIESFPTFSYAEVLNHQIGKGGALECAVCLNEYEEGETVRLVPQCDHVFHPECIGAWLQSHATCPVCRADLVPRAAEPANAPNDRAEASSDSSGNEETAISVEDNPREENSGNMPRSLPTQRPLKFKSHSFGHLPVQTGGDLDRFTLKLPPKVKEEVVNRCRLSRAKTFAAVLPLEVSSRRGYRTGGRSEGASLNVKFDRPVFIPRRLSSMSALTTVTESGEDSGASSRPPVKMLSFSCLEGKKANEDENPLVSDDSVRSV